MSLLVGGLPSNGMNFNVVSAGPVISTVYPSCGVGNVLKADVETKLSRLPPRSLGVRRWGWRLRYFRGHGFCMQGSPVVAADGGEA